MLNSLWEAVCICFFSHAVSLPPTRPPVYRVGDNLTFPPGSLPNRKSLAVALVFIALRPIICPELGNLPAWVTAYQGSF